MEQLNVESVRELDPEKLYAVRTLGNTEEDVKRAVSFLTDINQIFGLRFVLFSSELEIIDAPKNFKVVLADGE